MAIERKDRIVRYDILEYFKRAQDALNRRLYALKRELQALADKYSRLDTVETGAEVNVINGVKVKNENIVSVNNKIATIDLGDYTKNEVTEVLKAKLDGIHEFASEVVVNPQCEDGVTLAHISVNGEDKFIKRGVIEYEELENVPETFPPSPHTHDDRYYTESEIDSKVNTINSSIDTKADKTHTHDDRYYTESEIDSKLSVKSDITHLHDDRYYTESEADNLLSQKSDIGHTHSQYLTAGSMLNTANLQGIISVDNLPNAALERLVNVADDTARFALTEASVQLGDTVKVASTGLMYIIKDITRLNSEAGYEVYTAGSASAVPWSGVTGKPSTYAPSAHTHDDRYYTESEINTKLASKQNTLSAAGSATKGVYIDSSGTAKAMTYSVNKDVPSNAVFTDTVYTHPTTAGNKHIPSGGASGQILRWSADGTAVWGADNNTTYSPATQSANGLMSAADKKKLDGIATGANAYTHPNSGVTAGTYRSVTVNAQGHVTGGSNPTTLAGYGITDASLKGHTHDDRYYTESEIDSKLSTKSPLIGSTSLSKLSDDVTFGGGGAFSITQNNGSWWQRLRTVDASDNTQKKLIYEESQGNSGSSYTELFSVDGNGNAYAGGTLLSKNGHIHDDRYYTESEMNTKLAGKSDKNHTHDDRYYTESEINTKLSGKSDTSHTHSYLPLAGGTTTGKVNMKSANLDNLPQVFRTDGAYFAGIRFQNTNGYLGAIGITGNVNSVVQRLGANGTLYPILDSSNYNNYSPTKTGGGASGTWGISISGKANTAGTADIAKKVSGTYSHNGGQQGPAYFGRNSAGFLMSSAVVNSDTSYKNWLYMDNYNGDDVGGATAFGVSRVAPRAFLMQSDANRSSWNNYAELLSTYNYNTYVPKKDGTGASGTWGINISGNSATATKATQDSAGQQINTTYIKGLSVSGKTITYTKGNGTTGTITTQDTAYTHPNSGVTAGTYRNVTVNAQGHVTGGSNPTTLAGYGITDAVKTSDVVSSSNPYGKITRVGNDGVMEVGRYLDFHSTSNTNDYDIRLDVSGGVFNVTNGTVKATNFQGTINSVSITKDSSGNIIIS